MGPEASRSPMSHSHDSDRQGMRSAAGGSKFASAPLMPLPLGEADERSEAGEGGFGNSSPFDGRSAGAGRNSFREIRVAFREYTVLGCEQPKTPE